MIRSGIGTDPEVLRHHPLAQRVAGAECRDQFSRPFSSREKYFLLTFPLIEREGAPISLGPRAISIGHWLLVNTHVTAADLTFNNDTGPMLRIRPVSDIDCK